MNSQKKAQTSSGLSVTGMFIVMTLLVASTSVAFGQERSKDRDNPTPLTANELNDDLDDLREREIRDWPHVFGRNIEALPTGIK